MAFFNEFPFTRCYDSDLAWLIRRMKEVLARMGSVEERMAALEQLVYDFIATLDINQAIKDALQAMIDDGAFDDLLNTLFNQYTQVINQRMDTQDAKISTLEQQINTVINNFMISVNNRIADIENRLSGFYTKQEVENLIRPVYDVAFDQDVTWGADVDYRYGRGLKNFVVSTAHLKIINFSSNLTRVLLSINGKGDRSEPVSTSYSPELSINDTLKNRIKDIFKSSNDHVISKNPSGHWNNSFTFDNSNNLDGVILVNIAQGWNPPYTANSASIWTDCVYYNLAR